MAIDDEAEKKLDLLWGVREIADLVEQEEIGVTHALVHPTEVKGVALRVEHVDQVGRVEREYLEAALECLDSECSGEKRFPRAHSAREDHVTVCAHEFALCEVADNTRLKAVLACEIEVEVFESVGFAEPGDLQVALEATLVLARLLSPEELEEELELSPARTPNQVDLAGRHRSIENARSPGALAVHVAARYDACRRGSVCRSQTGGSRMLRLLMVPVTLLGTALTSSCATPVPTEIPLEDGYVALRHAGSVIEYRPEHRQLALEVAHRVASWQEEFEARYGEAIRSRIEAGSDEILAENLLQMPPEDQERIIQLVAETFVSEDDHAHRERILETARTLSAQFIQLAKRELGASEIVKRLRRFLLEVPASKRYRIVTPDDNVENLTLGFLWREGRSGDAEIEVVQPEFPDFVPVVIDEGAASGYHFLLDKLASSLEEDKSGDSHLGLEIIAHEVAEGSLLHYTRWHDPFRRWFTDGCAQYVALKCVETIQGHEARQKGLYGPEERKRYEDMRERVNLLAWLAVEWQDKYPEWAAPVATAHYASATAEIEHFVDTYGEAALRQVIRRIAAAEEKDSRKLRGIFFEATGSHDFWERLRAYSVNAARQRAAELSRTRVDAVDAGECYRLALRHRAHGDLESTWEALEVLVALEPADLFVRMLRALVIAEKDGEDGLAEIHRAAGVKIVAA